MNSVLITRLVNDWLLEGQSGVGVESLAGQQLEETKLKQLAQNSKKSKGTSCDFDTPVSISFSIKMSNSLKNVNFFMETAFLTFSLFCIS